MRSTLRSLTTTKEVVGALILRDLRTRFGRSPVNYLLSMAWPFVHLMVVLLAAELIKRPVHLGTDRVTFYAVSFAPFIFYAYPLRWIAFSVLQNKPLLSFPRVKVVDILLARIILETISACWVCVFVFATLAVLGFELQPHDVPVMMLGLVSAIYLGIAYGLILSVVISIMPGANVLVALFVISFYLASGTLFLPGLIPEPFRYWLSFFPLLHSVELTRMGYYASFYSPVFDAQYLLWLPTVLIALALVLQKSLRRFIVNR